MAPIYNTAMVVPQFDNEVLILSKNLPTSSPAELLLISTKGLCSVDTVIHYKLESKRFAFLYTYLESNGHSSLYTAEGKKIELHYHT